MRATFEFIPPVIGHRGACSYAPENTMSSFVKAAQLGVKWVEFDARLACDDEPMIFHDDSLNRTTNGKGKVSEFPMAYLASLDAGSWFSPAFSSERIPTLSTVISFLMEAKMSANIELKTDRGHEEKLVDKIMQQMSSLLQNHCDQFIFSSFSLLALKYMREYSPNCHIGLLLHKWKNDWEEKCLSLNCLSVHVNHEILSATLARKIKAMNKLLLCYTVNDVTLAQRLFSWGVDAVFSDTPDRIIQSGTIQNKKYKTLHLPEDEEGARS